MTTAIGTEALSPESAFDTPGQAWTGWQIASRPACKQSNAAFRTLKPEELLAVAPARGSLQLWRAVDRKADLSRNIPRASVHQLFHAR